jgi:hypothetical protein
VDQTNRELRGVGLSFGYALENEAYRLAPALLRDRYGIELSGPLVRADVAGEEVNLLGRGRRGGREVWVVGEAKARLTMRPGKHEDAEPYFAQLDRKMEAVREEKGDVEIVPPRLTHFASKPFFQEAEKRGVIVLQSYEW